jgi:hypothetical protein
MFLSRKDLTLGLEEYDVELRTLKSQTRYKSPRSLLRGAGRQEAPLAGDKVIRAILRRYRATMILRSELTSSVSQLTLCSTTTTRSFYVATYILTDPGTLNSSRSIDL